MHPDRLHAATAPDGTRIAGHVLGDGPPLVLVHGSLEDGDTCWRAMLPWLTRRFTCYLPSTRNRGASGAAADLTPQRRIEDVVAFVESIGEPVYLFGESDGGALALGAAGATAAVRRVAVYEPTVFEVADEQLQATLETVLPSVVDAVEHDRPADAAERFARLIANDDELSALSASGYLVEAGRYMPVFLRELEQDAASNAPGPTDPSRLGSITAPTLCMYGSRTRLRGWFERGARHVAVHVRDGDQREIGGAGHFGVAFHPEPIAAELARFLTSVPSRR